MKFVLLTLSLFLLLSCTSQTVKKSDAPPPVTPPDLKINLDNDSASIDHFLQTHAQNHQELNVQWWTTYQRARLWSESNSQVSCNLYLSLANEYRFPLRELAWLRAKEQCPGDTADFSKKRRQSFADYPEWLQALAVDASLRRAHANNDDYLKIDLLLEKSKRSLRRKEKVQLTEQALTLAQSLLGDKDLKNKAAELQKRLYKLAPRKIPRPQKQDYLRVAYDLRRARKFDKAISYYKKGLGRRTTVNLKRKSYQSLRQTYKIQRQLDKYLLYTEKLAVFDKSQYRKRKSKLNRNRYFNSLLTLARSYWTLGLKRKAKKSLSIAQRFEGKRSLTDVYFLLARMHEEDRQYKKALDYFERALSQPIRTAKFREKVLWYKAWNLFKLGRYSEAQFAFRELIDSVDGDAASARYRFWLAQTLRAYKLEEPAQEQFLKVIEQAPLSYYGLLAHYKLNKKIAPPQPPTDTASIDDYDKSLSSELDLNYLKWLVAVEEKKVAKRYLDFQMKAFRKKNDSDHKTWLAFFHYYAEAGDYLGLYYQLGQLSPEQKRQVLAQKPELLFPKPFYEQVTSAANRFGMTPEIIYSIMRQESAFNPYARSHMDAFGLMQLLPRVARETGEKINVSFTDDEELFKPHVNIPLGSAFLRQLWDEFHSHLILMAASYNASGKAIRGWLRTRYRGDSLEFIEDIPYEETQNYVKLIIRNLVFYKVIGLGQPTLFPEWVIDLSGVDPAPEDQSPKAASEQ